MKLIALADLLTDPVRLPLLLAAVTIVARVIYALISRVVQPFPRARAAVEALAAATPDVLRAGLQVVAIITGKPAPKLDLVPVGDPDPRVIEAASRAVDVVAADWKARALAAEARVAELTAADDAEEPGKLRPTVVPGEEPARSPDETTAAAATSRHRIAGTRGAV